MGEVMKADAAIPSRELHDALAKPAPAAATARVVMPHATGGRTRADKLRAFSKTNLRLAPHLFKTMSGGRADQVARDFQAHWKAEGFEFTYDGVSGNIRFSAPILKAFAAQCGETISYLEIGAYEGMNLGFLDWFLPGRLDVTVIDPWFDETFNPDDRYQGIEARFHRNTARMRFRGLQTHRGFSGDELPRMRAEGRQFDLIYVDGSHTALDVMIDLTYCASLLRPGGMMILDDYWHDISDIGGPGVKQAVDGFLKVFGRYFEILAVYRQVVLRKTNEPPR